MKPLKIRWSIMSWWAWSDEVTVRGQLRGNTVEEQCNVDRYEHQSVALRLTKAAGIVAERLYQLPFQSKFTWHRRGST